MGHGDASPRLSEYKRISANAPSNGNLTLLATRLQKFSNRNVRALLRPIIHGRRTFKRDQPAWAERGELSNIFVIESGWAYKFDMLRDGQRHIADFFGPGSICNWSRLSNFEEQDDILFKSGCRATLIDKRGLEELLEANAGLSSLFKRHELARTMRTTQRVRAFISLPAIERTLVLLLDLYDELEASGGTPVWLQLPFVQTEIADMLGLTPVHVSRVFAKLTETEVVERRGRSVRIIDRAAVEDELAYRHFFNQRS